MSKRIGDHRKTEVVIPRDIDSLNRYLIALGLDYKVKLKSDFLSIEGQGVFGDTTCWSHSLIKRDYVIGLSYADWVDLFMLLSGKSF